MEREVVMTGIGGQGIQLMAKLLAQAAIREGREVMTFGIFMGTIRGGASESTVVIADREIVAPPIVPATWSVVAMHPAGLGALERKIRPGGVLVVNSTLVVQPPAWPGVHAVAVPATELAKAAGQAMSAGMVALGAFATVTALVSVAALDAALGDVLPPHRRALVETNRRCIARGAEWVTANASSSVTPAWA